MAYAEAISDCPVRGGPELKLSWATQTLPRLIKKHAFPRHQVQVRDETCGPGNSSIWYKRPSQIPTNCTLCYSDNPVQFFFWCRQSEPIISVHTEVTRSS